MYTYAFQLGRQRDLCQEEIYAVFKSERYVIAHSRLVGEYFLISFDTPIDAKKLMGVLGGTKLIAEKIEATGNAEETMFSYLSDRPSDHKLHFAVSGTKQANRLGIALKKKLKAIGRSVRFVEVKNTASILHNGLIERGTHLTIIDNVVYVTRAIQPIEELSKRDYGRPNIDDKSGMLPPKLARMMVNLTMQEQDDTLLDPFCGSGTLLGEAMTLGIKNIVGSDISERAITDSKVNTEWLETSLPSPVSSLNIFQADVRSLSEQEVQKINVIATEPYMGVPRSGREQKTFLQKQATELKTLYIEAFKSFAKIMTAGGRVVFVIPRFRIHDEEVRIDCKREIAALGFDLLPYQEADMPLLYAREGQFVEREIWRWVKK